MRRNLYFVIGLAVIAVPPSSADVKPNSLFSDNAVLQQGMPVPVWGTARDGEKVTVQLGDQKASTTAIGGKWRVTLNALKAGGPFTLTMKGDNTVEAKNVLVGEVWICSGQSNMQMTVRSSADAQQNIDGSADPQLRLVTIPRQGTDEPLSDVRANWSDCTPQSVPDFSAVAYFFGRELRKDRKVPVGLISTNYGGTPAEAWTSKSALSALPELAYYTTQGNRRKDAGRPMALYNAMIAPLIPYAIRGAIWYQGESNADRSWEYRTLFPTMIKNWREDWGEGDFPFFFVQLAPFMKIQPDPVDSAWAELRDSQLYTALTVPKTAQAVIVDVGDENDIHPKKKEPVGQRLALAARAIAYKEKVPYLGPSVSKMKVNGNRIELTFKNTDGGLTAPGGEVKGFAIAGADRKFQNAKATIEGNKVTVWNEHVLQPVAVRYGWANFPVVSLQNGAGLYASPFRTDDWPYTTKK